MSKLAEQNYLALTGQAGKEHSLSKPFSDAYCGSNLAAIGIIMGFLPDPPARILDMGCGGGWTSIFFAKRGYEVVGLDISQDMVDLANINKECQKVGANLSFACSDYEMADFKESFDAVIFYDCLHHAEDERAALASAYSALKPGGMVITHEPGEGHSVAPGSIEAMQLYGVDERDMPPHLIIRHGEELGFKTSRVYPLPDELLSIFYREPIPRLISKGARNRSRRVLSAAFRPSLRAGGIVVMTK